MLIPLANPLERKGSNSNVIYKNSNLSNIPVHAYTNMHLHPHIHHAYQEVLGYSTDNKTQCYYCIMTTE